MTHDGEYPSEVPEQADLFTYTSTSPVITYIDAEILSIEQVEARFGSDHWYVDYLKRGEATLVVTRHGRVAFLEPHSENRVTRNGKVIFIKKCAGCDRCRC